MREYYIKYTVPEKGYFTIFLTKEDCSKERRIYASPELTNIISVCTEWGEFEWGEISKLDILILTKDEAFLEML